MKKPNITEGEWAVSDFKPQVGVLKYNGLAMKVICEFDKEMDWMDEPDMKAISAVPEMIDALIESHEVLKNCLYRGENRTKIATTNDKAKALEIIESALKKAGVEL